MAGRRSDCRRSGGGEGGAGGRKVTHVLGGRGREDASVGRRIGRGKAFVRRQGAAGEAKQSVWGGHGREER